MSWPLSTHSDRLTFGAVSPLLVPGSGDVVLTLTRSNALFWARVRSDGADVRAYDASGLNVLEHKLSAWNYAARTATITIRGVPLPGPGDLNFGFLVFGHAGASSTASTFTEISPIAGVLQADSTPPWPLSELIPLNSGRYVAGRLPTFKALAGVARVVWLDVGEGYLGRRVFPYGGRLNGEELSSVGITASTDSPGVGVCAVSPASLSIETLGNGPVLRVALDLSGAVAGESYRVAPRITTTQGQTYSPVFRVTCA